MSDRILIQVTNPADYGVDYFAIEANDFYLQGEMRFAVPAWEERGLSELCGPFATAQEAHAVLQKDRDYIEWLGYAIA
jgi:hypothetical protein